MKRFMYVVLFFSAVHCAADSNLNNVEKVGLATAAGIAEGISGLPCGWATDLRTNGAKEAFFAVLKRDFKAPYRGFWFNAAMMAPLCGLQKALEVGLTHVLLQKGEQPTATQGLAIAAGAGVGAALVATPQERVLFLMRTLKMDASSAVANLFKLDGLRGVLRGFGPLATRDAVFTAAWLKGNGMVKGLVAEHLVDNPLVTVPAAAVVVGVPAGMFTQALHVARARQFAHRGSTGKSFVRAVREVYQEGGVKALHKGGVPRALRIVSALATMGFVMDELAQYYTALKNKLSE